MLHRTEGIVLRTIPFGDADLIVFFLTPDYGILKTFAKSPLKTKSRFGSSLEPLTHARIAYWGKEDATLPRLTQSDIIHPFQLIRDSLGCFLMIIEILELTLQLIPEGEANKKVYSLFLHTLHNIENNLPEAPYTPLWKRRGERDFKRERAGLDLWIIHYKIKFLKFTGYAPKLDACGRCGKNGHCFYVSQGSIICEACTSGMDSPVKIPQRTVKLYSDLLTWDIAKVNRIRASDIFLSELSNIIGIHIKHVLTKPLKCETFIRSLSH